MTARGPQRRSTDNHVHTEYWTEEDQHRFEQRLGSEIKGVKEEVKGLHTEVKGLNNRLTLMMGGLALIAFLLPIVAPFIRSATGLP